MPNVPMLQLANDVENLAKNLIPNRHPHLKEAKILYIFTDQKRKSCEKVKLASASKMTALQRFLSSTLESVEGGYDYYLLFDIHEWEQLTAKQQQALVSHELYHCTVQVKDGKFWRRLLSTEDKNDFPEWRYGRRGHTIEEFHEIIQEYGWWKGDEDEQHFAEAVKQLSLPGLAILAQSRN